MNEQNGDLVENPKINYIKKLELLPLKNDFPQFDLVILGVGKDGHIGSLYLNRKEVLNKNEWVIDVDKVFLLFLLYI